MASWSASRGCALLLAEQARGGQPARRRPRNGERLSAWAGGAQISYVKLKQAIIVTATTPEPSLVSRGAFFSSQQEAARTDYDGRMLNLMIPLHLLVRRSVRWGVQPSA